MKKIILLFVLFMIFSACKNDKKESKLDLEDNKQERLNKQTKNSNFTIKLNAKVQNDDKFWVLYTEEPGELFSVEKRIIKPVKGSDLHQEIEFIFPDKNIYPARLRLNVGTNREQKIINIKSIEILHEESQIMIADTVLNKYFFPSKYIDLTENNGEIILNIKDGKYVPFLVSKKLLEEELSTF